MGVAKLHVFCRMSHGFHKRARMLSDAAGAGGAYLIDFFMFVTKRNIRLANPVHLCYSSRSVALFQFVTNMVCQVISSCDAFY